MIPALITTDRLFLRPPAPEDSESFIDFYASDRSEHVGGKKTRNEAWRAFSGMIGHWQMRGFGMFAVCLRDSNDALGLVGPWFPEGWAEREIAWMILREGSQGKGIAFEAAQATRAWAYRTLDWRTAVSYVSPRNHRSIRLAERLGASPDSDSPHGFDVPCVVYRHPGPEALA